MSSVIPDLWPTDIKADDVLTPEEILQEQAKQLEIRTNGLLQGHIAKAITDDRIVLGLEVKSSRFDGTTQLFEVQHRKDLEYPVNINAPDEQLPLYLRKSYYSPSLLEAVSTHRGIATLSKGEWKENAWVASAPDEFKEMIGQILASASVKAIVLSLIARANKNTSHDEKQ